MENTENKHFIEEFKDEWKNMWRNRLDDKVRAEGIASKDYSLLSVDRGTVIMATRKFKLLDLKEILQQRGLSDIGEIMPPNPSVGGWGKFAKTVLRARTLSSNSLTKRGRQAPAKPDRHLDQQLKKGGRGWLHVKK